MNGICIAIKTGIAAIGGALAYWLGGLDQLLIALLLLIVLDYVSGVVNAIQQKKLSSAVGLKGISKKVFILIIVAVAYIIEDITGKSLPLREIVITFFIANEGISIIENAAQAGLPLPEKLTDVLIQLSGKKKPTEKSDDE